MSIDGPKIETVGFGFEPAGGAYHFVVTIPPGEDGTVTVAEHFVYGESVEEAAVRSRFADTPLEIVARPPRPKVTLAVSKWQRVAEEVRSEFNRRLLGRGQKRATWKPGENRLAPHLGKELVLLLWAIEDANPGDIPNAVANWQGLVPEERWWLYTTTNAATGHVSEGRGRGWRRAIQIAFTENPVTTIPTYFERNSVTDVKNGYAANGSSPATSKRGKHRRAANDDTQPTLLNLNEETTEP